MIIKHISLTNFRSHARLELDIPQAGVLICGPNGAGKTNLLEAICYFAFGKSIRGATDSECLTWGTDYFMLRAVVEAKGHTHEYSGSWDGTRKGFRVDGNPLPKLSSLYDQVKIVYFSPDDISLISGGPAGRRKFIDQSMCQQRPYNLHILRDFHQTLKERNALLKTTFDSGVKEAWDDRFIKSAVELYKARRVFLEQLGPHFARLHQAIAPGDEVCLAYHPGNGLKSDDIAEEYQRLCRQLLPREQECGRSLFGPHLDDIDLILNGRLARDYASQGQKRLLALTARLAQAALLDSGSYNPVVIFDDVFAELDSQRTALVGDLITPSHQVLVATPKPHTANLPNLPRLNLTTQ